MKYLRGAFVLLIIFVVSSLSVEAIPELDWNFSTYYGSSYLTDIECKLDSNNLLHVLFVEPNQHLLRYGTYNGTRWNIETILSDFHSDAAAVFDLDSENKPHFVYQQSNFLYYLKPLGDSWYTDLIDSTGAISSPSFDFLLDTNNHPHVVYTVWEPDVFNSRIKYAVYTQGDWNIIEVDSGVNIGNNITCVLDSDDTIHFLYLEYPLIPLDSPPNLWYVSPLNDLWISELLDENQYTQPDFSSIAVDSNNRPHVCYADYIPAPSFDRNLKYAKNTSGQWEFFTVDAVGYNKGKGCELVVDAWNNVHIVYDNVESEEYIKYGYYDGVSWYLETLETGRNPSITLDMYNLPHICYEKNRMQYAYQQPKESNPPENLRIILFSDHLELTWDPPSFNGGTEIKQYTIYRGTAATTLIKYTTLGVQYIFDDYAVEKNSTYYYQVTASNTIGESLPSFMVTKTIPFISVTLPDAQEKYYIEDVINIEWDASSIGDFVTIKLYQNGTFYKTISSETGNDGVFAWTIPTDIPSDNSYEIRIFDAQNPNVFATSSVFSIDQEFTQTYGILLGVGVIVILLGAIFLLYFIVRKRRR